MSTTLARNVVVVIKTYPTCTSRRMKKTKKVFRCLVCPNCGSSESKTTRFVTRDLNSALNIRNLAVQWITDKTRPSAFCPPKVGKEAEGMALPEGTGSLEPELDVKGSQSVDFTVGNATIEGTSANGLTTMSRRLKCSLV